MKDGVEKLSLYIYIVVSKEKGKERDLKSESKQEKVK